jgi:hypothetical protein
MDEPTLKLNMRVNFERLRGSYEKNLDKFNLAGLWDLAHHLRQWNDLRRDVDSYLSRTVHNSARFYGYRLTDGFKKLLHNKECIIAHFPPDGFIVKRKLFKENVSIINIKPEYILPTKGQVSTTLDIKQIDSGMMFTRFYQVFEKIGEFDRFATVLVGKYNFGAWMDTEVIRVFTPLDGKKTLVILSRKTVIERLANYLGGSHPIGHEPKDVKENLAINKLMYVLLFDVPILYMILMKTAEEILDMETVAMV